MHQSPIVMTVRRYLLVPTGVILTLEHGYRVIHVHRCRWGVIYRAHDGRRRVDVRVLLLKIVTGSVGRALHIRVASVRSHHFLADTF